MSDNMVHLGLNIDDRPGAIQMTLMPYEDEQGKHIQVQALGIEASQEGAMQVVATLLVTAELIAVEMGKDIKDLLDMDKTPPVPPRRGFNPRPAGPQTGSK